MNRQKLRVLVLLNPEHVPPDTLKGHSEQEIMAWKTGWDVVSALRRSGHAVHVLSVQEELRPIREAIEQFKPEIVFNLLEQFHGVTMYDQNVASYLELLRVPYTGCNPRGLMLARGKDLSKKLLAYHRIPVPAFAVYPKGRKVRKPDRLSWPLIVKSLSEDASRGIAQASVVTSDDKLAERVALVHERVGTAAIVEEYIAGRELYVSVIGNERMRVLPIWELEFGTLSTGIATEKVKFDPEYQEKRGILQGLAENIPPELQSRIEKLVRRICRNLDLDGYARIDFRLTAEGVPYFLEANPNPEIARQEVFAEAARYDGLGYQAMINRILRLGIARAKVMAAAG
jgi:D-alanine-D-alanine ligase